MIILSKFDKHKNIILIVTAFIIVFFINISIHYSKYQEVIYEEVYETKVEVVNIYKKLDYDVLKLKSKDFIFFTSHFTNEEISKFDILTIGFITTRISFIDYLKGFYTKTIYIDKLENISGFKQTLIKSSDSQHYNEMIKELFNALFLAVPVSKELRDICANYGISHLIALSGFHLGVLSFLIYWILYFPYNFFHTRYFPYRNIKFDLLLVTIAILFFYLILTNLVPSLLRSFVMLVIGIFLLRANIKLFSFFNLFIVLLIITVLFPKYLFSLSLWFSLFGVFYIFLFIQYFKDLRSKIVQLLFFNFWIYFAMNPIVHFFFPVTTYEQLYSPFITLGFTLFYPLELFLHFIGYGNILDEYLIVFFNHEFKLFEVYTPLWFFILFIVNSLTAIFYKSAFWLLNIFLFLFNLYLFY